MKRILLFGILLLVVLIVGGFGLRRFEQFYRRQVVQVKAEERQYWQDKTGQLKAQLGRLEEEIKYLKLSEQTRRKVSGVFKDDPFKVLLPEEDTTPEKAVFQLVTFFAYLDQQDYVKTYKLPGGSQQAFRMAVAQLLQNPPLFSAELLSLKNLGRNLGHFRSVLGRRPAAFFAEVFSRETELLEPVLRAFFFWFTHCRREDSGILDCPSLPQLYEYASFFLGTFAGRNYLFETHPKLRVLLTYYSVLVIDRALDERLNPNGIDIRPHIANAMAAMDSQKDLIGLKDYQATLKKLAGKHQLG